MRRQFIWIVTISKNRMEKNIMMHSGIWGQSPQQAVDPARGMGPKAYVQWWYEV